MSRCSWLGQTNARFQNRSLLVEDGILRPGAVSTAVMEPDAWLNTKWSMSMPDLPPVDMSGRADMAAAEALDDKGRSAAARRALNLNTVLNKSAGMVGKQPRGGYRSTKKLRRINELRAALETELALAGRLQKELDVCKKKLGKYEGGGSESSR